LVSVLNDRFESVVAGNRGCLLWAAPRQATGVLAALSVPLLMELFQGQLGTNQRKDDENGEKQNLPRKLTDELSGTS
jgi:hypothetical protein